MSNPITLINTALVTKLKAHSGIAADGGRIAEHPAPDGLAYPLYTFQQNSGGDSNDTPRRNLDIFYLIECWSDNLSQAQRGSGYIDEALHNQELTISGWSNWRMENTGFKSLPSELIGGRLIHRRGAMYKVSIAQNS